MGNSYSHDNGCIDCGKLISNEATRCRKCYVKNNRGENHPRYCGVTICPKCGNKKFSESVVCRECYLKNPFRRFKENNPAWKGGINDYSVGGRDRDLSSFEYATWRLKVFTRDNFTCQHCGKNGDLQAHHIQNFSEHRKLRLEVDNGITFCKNCHQLFHSLFSKKDNNLGQLEWFFKNVKLRKG